MCIHRRYKGFDTNCVHVENDFGIIRLIYSAEGGVN